MDSVDLRVLPSADLPVRAAEALAETLREAVASRGGAAIALAGGTTPRAVYEALASIADIPWASVSVFFGDERCVPLEHPESNHRMAMESLLGRVPIPPRQVHAMPVDMSDRDAAARAYEALLPAALDSIVLGVGEDGHTASLFPGSAALSERERLVLAVIGPKPPPERLTLTPLALARARRRFVLATGAGKAEAVARALSGAWDPLRTPAQLGRDGTWFVDAAAASGLTRA